MYTGSDGKNNSAEQPESRHDETYSTPPQNPTVMPGKGATPVTWDTKLVHRPRATFDLDFDL
jgi:hypothetical protein